MTKISRRKFLQISGLAAGASMLPMPMKWLGAGSAEAFLQSPALIPLYGTSLRLGEIPVAIPCPLPAGALPGNMGLEFAANEKNGLTIPGMSGTQNFPWGFPQTGMTGNSGAPVTGVRHYSLTLQEFRDDGVVPTLTPNPGNSPNIGTKLWGYRPDLTLLEGLTALGFINGAHNPFATAPLTQPSRQLGGIIIAEAGPAGQPLQITMRNNLPLTSIIPNDMTVPGSNLGEDRTTVHYHGGLMPWISDGGPFDWFCSAKRIGVKPLRTGQSFLNNVVLNPAADTGTTKYTQGEFFWNINQQSARFVWFHDHAWGITRTNAYAGVATGLVLRDNFERSLIAKGLPPLLENSLLDGINMYNSFDGTNPATVGQAPFTSKGFWPVCEYPLVFQDKIFTGANIKLLDSTWTGPKDPGSLWYPHTYEGSRWRRIATAAKLPTNSVIAEMFGDTMLVNGTASPVLDVEPRLYRFRLLNACNARFLNLQLYKSDGSATGITLNGSGAPTNAAFVNNVTGASSWAVLGNECGFLEEVKERPCNVALTSEATPVTQNWSLLLGSAFRPDVLVDFSRYQAGDEIILYNDAPSPFPGGDPRNDYFPGLNNGNPVNTKNRPADGLAHNTRCIMKFRVVTGTGGMNPSATNQIVPGFSFKAQGAEWNAETQNIQQNANGVYTINGTVYNGTTPPAVWNSIGDGTTTINLTTGGNAFKLLGLFEAFDAHGRLEQRLGSLDPQALEGKEYIAAPEATDYVNNGAGGIEVWAIHNTTADVHPMHFHMSNWQGLGRAPYSGAGNVFTPSDAMRGPFPEEFGFKETILCWPFEVVYILAKWNIPQIEGPGFGNPAGALADPRTVHFDPPVSPRFPGENVHETVWHCHILEHEEHDMMRPVLIRIPRNLAAQAYPTGYPASLRLKA